LGYICYVDFVRISNSSGTFDTTYIMHEGQKVVEVKYDGAKQFMHDDHLGSTGAITDSVGTVVEQTTYSPFGEIVSGGEMSRFDYTGKEYDSLVRDYDFNARKYKAEWGLFLQPDRNLPVIYDPQQLNRYSYARNNPYNYVDPTGKAAIWIHYQDTYQSYRAAGFSDAEARQVAAGAVEPDLYRVVNQGGFLGLLAKGAAAHYNLDLEMNHMDDAEQFYHSSDIEEGGPLGGVSPQEHIKILLKEYGEAVEKGDLEAMGNLEHALGHDIGSGKTPGYHTGSGSYNQAQGFHVLNDVFGLTTNRVALQREQLARAQGAYSQREAKNLASGKTVTKRNTKSFWMGNTLVKLTKVK